MIQFNKIFCNIKYYKNMSEHYIQIDSTFRNRKENPNPFDFNVIVSNSGNSSNSNIALNPISNAYPIYNFQGPHPELLGIDKDFVEMILNLYLAE